MENFQFRNWYKPYGENRDWNDDISPKCIIANNSLVKILPKINVSQYLKWELMNKYLNYNLIEIVYSVNKIKK